MASDAFRKLQDGYREDVAASEALTPVHIQSGFAVYQLPNASWARRVSGVFSNDLVRAYPERAHAVLTERDDDSFLVSERPSFSRTSASVTVFRVTIFPRSSNVMTPTDCLTKVEL